MENNNVELLEELEGENQILCETLQNIGPILKASVCRRNYLCGKANCRCTKGYLHSDLIITRKINGKTQTTKVPKIQESEILKRVQNWKEMNKILHNITSTQVRIIRIKNNKKLNSNIT